MKRSIVFIVVLLSLTIATTAQKGSDGSTPSIAGKIKDLPRYSGYFDFFWDESTGKIYLEIDKWDREFLMVSYLSKGMGANDVGLDRGKIGDQKVVAFQRRGNKVLLMEPNYRYRAESGDEAERRAVDESFARSVIWGFKV